MNTYGSFAEVDVEDLVELWDNLQWPYVSIGGETYELIGYGAYRIVLLKGEVVYKLARFESGRFSNLRESRLWNQSKHPLLGEVYSCTEDGSLLTMKYYGDTLDKCESLSDDEIEAEANTMWDMIQRLFNSGIITRRIIDIHEANITMDRVLIDYG